jgi:hypothetical protein
MLTSCTFCHRPFESNEELEHLRAGSRIAFDPARGRLWCVCSHCQGWTLLPIEQRWEALEELERLTRDQAKLLVQGENIGLYRAQTLGLIRIGRAALSEEAWWRYGDELARRRVRAGRITKRGKIIDAVTWLALFGVPVWTDAYAEDWLNRARRFTFGKLAWSGAGHCRRCNRALRKLPFSKRGEIQLHGGLETMSLQLPCACGPQGGVMLEGPAADHLLRRILAYHNFAGASRTDIVRASRFVETAIATPQLGNLLAERRTLAQFGPASALALEIAVNHSIERAWLQLEAAELETRWRKEEAIAAIADGELTL